MVFLKKLTTNYKKVYRYTATHIWSIVFIALLALSLTINLIPEVSFRTGNIFFGEVKGLYNIQLAQFFYKRSINSFFHVDPPRYAHYQLSRTYFIQGDLYAALNEAKEEIKLFPENTKTYYILGLTYGYMNQEKNAIEAFSRYIDTHPNTWAGRNDKAWLQFRIGDIDGAIQTLEPVVKNDPNNIWVQNTYCALMINKRDFVNAKKACDNAKRIADVMTEEMWGTAYPGNDPRVYGDGLQAIKKSLQENIKLITNNSQSIVNKP